MQRAGRRILTGIVAAAGAVLICIAAWHIWLAPTKVLIINAREGQQADMALNNDTRAVKLSFLSDYTRIPSLKEYDAVIMLRRGAFLGENDIAELEMAASRGATVFINSPEGQEFDINGRLPKEVFESLSGYFGNPCRENYRNGFRYLRGVATPNRKGGRSCQPPTVFPSDLLFHREYGKYFTDDEELTAYLKGKGLYNEGGARIVYIPGRLFPVEGNRPHVDTLISILTGRGFNVYPLTALGKKREAMVRAVHPDAVIYTPMGRLGGDGFIQWLHSQNILIFNPFPLLQSHSEWMDPTVPVTGGTLTARVVIPEIDGGLAPLCIATQKESDEGYSYYAAEVGRIDALADHISSCLALRSKPNSEKKVALCYFKSPGKDALLASGMEVAPSIYNFLLRLRDEGYDVSGLPSGPEAFTRMLRREGSVMGSYAAGAQAEFLKNAHPVWISKQQYEKWTSEALLPQKYAEITELYGEAPGGLLARGDSIAMACLRFGNILLFPQPRPALGEDSFKLVHGAAVAPPHSYVAPYLYVRKGFKADAIIHFGTHGSLEFTPGKNAGLSQADWPEALIGSLPHFYYYTTGNVGEAVIAKRRTHAALVTYLTPPFVESGLRSRYTALLDDIHKALGEEGGSALGTRIKEETLRLGLHRDLGLDSTAGRPYSRQELEKLDSFIEELADEKITGAYYTMGRPYSQSELLATTLAVAADPLAYEMARRDRDAGRISTGQLQDFDYLRHHYLPSARRRITALLADPPKDTALVASELRPALECFNGLLASTRNEFDAMVKALEGGTIAPAPGGDPVLKPNVLPTGRNMYGVNAEATPSERAWEDGARLADKTLEEYLAQHGEYPRKVSYTFWAGEFISTEGATIAQAFRMLGVEPLRDKQGHVVDLRLIPASELGRPRINVAVQVSGQLRDIAASRLTLLTEAIKMASEAPEEGFPNFVASGTRLQEKLLLEEGLSPQRARKLSVMRIFGPLNSGYGSGMLDFVENSWSWDDESQIAEGYLNNMGAAYGDEEEWAGFEKGLFAAALSETDAIVQPRQSNTWGPVSLDHVYEFTGGLSNAVRHLTGKEPEAYMADYRNRNNRRIQNVHEAVAVETRATLLNPVFISERMKGGEGSAQMFGEMFRNIFGWNATRPSALDGQLFDDLYKTYILDENGLGIREFFDRTNPAAYQAMTAVMLESARKGYWKASPEQLGKVAELHAAVTAENGPACTEFVCGNSKLERFISEHLEGGSRSLYDKAMNSMRNASGSDAREVVLKEKGGRSPESRNGFMTYAGIVGAALTALLVILLLILRRKREE